METLNLSNNLIDSVEDMEEVSQLESLSHFDISNNLLKVMEGRTTEQENNEINDKEDKAIRNDNEVKKEETINENNQNQEDFKEFILLYENFHTEINNKIYPEEIEFCQNLDSMNDVYKKKIFFLLKFITLMKKVKNLKTLFIKNNPFTTEIKYTKKYIIANIPRLVFLDDKKIKKTDIVLAQVFLKRGLKHEEQLQKILIYKKNEKYKNLTEKFHNFLAIKNRKTLE